MSNDAPPGYEWRPNPEYHKPLGPNDCFIRIEMHPYAMLPSNEQPNTAIVGEIPEEARATIIRLFQTCRSENYDAHGEFHGNGIHLKWAYLKHTGIMTVARAENPERPEISFQFPGRYTDPLGRHVHIQDGAHAIHTGDTLCGRKITPRWEFTLAGETCSACIARAKTLTP